MKYYLFIYLFFIFTANVASANNKKLLTISLPSTEELEIRTFAAKGNNLLIGFSCDNGSSVNEEKTAKVLADDGITVWMPDFLGAYMIAKTPKNLRQIIDEDLVYFIDNAIKNNKNKNAYVVASGKETALLLRAVVAWEKKNLNSNKLKGAILLFPRLNAATIEPGVEPKYVNAVGKTKIPLIVIEGGRTPSKWGLPHLKKELARGGSNVITKIIPKVRGYFFSRDNPNKSEKLVSSQLSGLMKVSLFYLRNM